MREQLCELVLHNVNVAAGGDTALRRTAANTSPLPATHRSRMYDLQRELETLEDDVLLDPNLLTEQIK
jgi:hypothetical protein